MQVLSSAGTSAQSADSCSSEQQICAKWRQRCQSWWNGSNIDDVTASRWHGHGHHARRWNYASTDGGLGNAFCAYLISHCYIYLAGWDHEKPSTPCEHGNTDIKHMIIIAEIIGKPIVQ